MADVEALPEVIVTEAVEDAAVEAGEPVEEAGEPVEEADKAVEEVDKAVEEADKAVEEAEKEMTLEERKEEEQAVIQRQIEQTQAEMERLEAMEGSLGEAGAQGFNLQQLEEMGIQITNVMEFSATIELSAPKDMAKLYNFTGKKSNLPRDDINLQFCRGVLKDRRNMLEDLKASSIRKKSLIDPQTILLLKQQEESNIVNERANFWRKAAITDKKEPKPQSERDSEWRAEFQKNNLGEGRKISGQFWRGVEFKSQEKERTPELEKGLTNRDKMKKKQDAWEVSLSDDSWYRAPTFSPEGNQSRRTDIEALCEIIYAYGERYEDGTAAIGFTWLFKMFNRANIVGILIKAKKHGLVFFDGEIVFAKPIGEVRRAFNEMRGRHADMFAVDGKRRQTLIIPDEDQEDSDVEEDTEDRDSESD